MLLTNKAFLFYNNQNQNKEFTMKCNIGKTDKMIRSIAGVAIIIVGVIYSSWFGLIGVVLLGTALVRFCPVYLPFSIDTSKGDEGGSCGGGGCGCGK
jgi:vacuolar-type H+-ATPase subunit I/STV1